MSYFAALMMLTSPLKRLAKVNEKVQIGVTAANSVFSVIDAEPEVDAGSMNLHATGGHLKFENVSFNYGRDDEHSVLKNISFEIEPGKRVALVGSSGSGKSTITSLILRFYAPQEGQITLDGMNINDVVLRDLRDQFSLVSQETTLFDDTIGRNIMYGMMDYYDEDRLQAAIEAAHVDEFLNELTQGLDTVVGEHGLRLSGGQRQRIAIARAIYKNAPILILDEATSALDNKSERYVQDALETLMKGRTSLVIAHRLTTIESADSIIVLDKGMIVEQGSHRQLLKKGGHYSELHRAQSKKVQRGFSFLRR
jgi:subfamily B ATP-binding cassette protein MsbA